YRPLWGWLAAQVSQSAGGGQDWLPSREGANGERRLVPWRGVSPLGCITCISRSSHSRISNIISILDWRYLMFQLKRVVLQGAVLRTFVGMASRTLPPSLRDTLPILPKSKASDRKPTRGGRDMGGDTADIAEHQGVYSSGEP